MEGRRRWLAPGVVQTSATDCGPASLTALLAGFDLPADLATIRDRGHTDVDGTSIDALQAMAGDAGLTVDQVVVPADHLLRADADLLPAIVVTTLPDGLTHFVLAWRRVGRFVQVMDPAVGRRWLSVRRFLTGVYVHEMQVPAAAWRDYAAGDDHLAVLHGRLADLGLPADSVAHRLDTATADPSWRGLARLDAAVRATAALAAARSLRRGTAPEALDALLSRPAPDAGLPRHLWSAAEGDDGDSVRLRGAVAVTVKGRTGEAVGIPADPPPGEASGETRPATARRRLQRFIAAQDPVAATVALVLAVVAGVTGTAEALALRTVVERASGPGGLTVATALVFLLVAVATIGVQVAVLRLGQRLDLGLRRAVADRLPRVADRYVATRPAFDIADRAHSLHRIGELPERSAAALVSTIQALACAAVLAWVEPRALLPALVLVAVAAAITGAGQPGLAERELRAQTVAGSLGQGLTDVLAGLPAVRAHGATPALTFQRDALLRSWAVAARSRHRWAAGVGAASRLAALAAAGWALAVVVDGGLAAEDALLAAFVAVLATHSLDVAADSLRSLSGGVAATDRLLEPLSAPLERGGSDALDPSASPEVGRSAGARVELCGVAVEAAGIQVLAPTDLTIPAECHVAVVGRSGAGKSSLLHVVLGLVDPHAGEVWIDGEPLSSCRRQVRRQTAWLDPGITLWHRSLGANVGYGQPAVAADDLGEAVEAAGIDEVAALRAGGLGAQTGHGGGLLSGGEGQRVRVARALARPGVRLVVADEPFRGLDRPARDDLAARCRARWRDATVIWATHDLEEALGFDLVVVVDEGRVVEVAAPGALGPGSRFAALLDADRALRHDGWADGGWRRVRVEDGGVDRIDDAEAAASP